MKLAIIHVLQSVTQLADRTQHRVHALKRQHLKCSIFTQCAGYCCTALQQNHVQYVEVTGEVLREADREVRYV